MKTASIDNSAESDINNVITWQFDNAENLIAVISIFKDFYKQSTEDFWNGISEKINLSDPDECDDYGLSIWGKLLGVARPTVSTTTDGVTTTHKISSELYRRILVGRLRLAVSNASIDAYIAFINYVFCTQGESSTTYNAKVVDGYDMSLSFSFTATATTVEEQEQKAVLENYPDIVFAFPAGVRSSDEDDGPVFGFFEQVRDADGNALTENAVIDDQSIASKTYTYTKNGYTYTKTHKDFKIANLDHGTIAWDRFSR